MISKKLREKDEIIKTLREKFKVIGDIEVKDAIEVEIDVIKNYKKMTTKPYQDRMELIKK